MKLYIFVTEKKLGKIGEMGNLMNMFWSEYRAIFDK